MRGGAGFKKVRTELFCYLWNTKEHKENREKRGGGEEGRRRGVGKEGGEDAESGVRGSRTCSGTLAEP